MKVNPLNQVHEISNNNAIDLQAMPLVLEGWANEIHDAFINNAEANTWSLIGKAALIVTQDTGEHFTLGKAIAAKAHYRYLEIDSSEIMERVANNDYFETDAPAIIYLPHGDWCKKLGRQINTEDQIIAQFQKNFASYLKGINPAKPIVFIAAVVNYRAFPEGLREVGLFDRRFEIPKPTVRELGLQFLNKVGTKICATSLLNHPGKVGKLIESDFDERRRQDLIALALKRIAHRESRLVEFSDLIEISIYGSRQMDERVTDNSRYLEENAIHEAGHALIAMIDSEGANIPDYASILETAEHAGIVVQSFAYHQLHDQNLSYAQMRHEIRVSLGGRAAEELLLGAENVSGNGSRTDLINATLRAKAMVGECGLSPSLDKLRSHRDNLAVITGKPTNSEKNAIKRDARIFLSEQFSVVTKLIERNRDLLDSIIENLLAKTILDQNDLIEILNLKMRPALKCSK